MVGRSMIQARCRTMWEASRDLLEAGQAARCEATWERGFRLWLAACTMNAKGEPFTLEPYIARWLP